MKPLIIIDPGHGGKDPGGGSCKLFLEKDWSLKVSLYQAALFYHAGITALLTRDRDRDLSPAERTRLVRNSNADICISNHVNAGGGTGFEVFHSTHANPALGNCVVNQFKTTNMPIRQPPVKTRQQADGRDFYFMHRDTGSVQTLIIEYGFADNREDAEKLWYHWKWYAEAAFEGVMEYLRIKR